MWGRQRAECLKPQHLVALFSCHHYTETPGGLCGAFLGVMAMFVTHVNGKCHQNLGKRLKNVW